MLTNAKNLENFKLYPIRFCRKRKFGDNYIGDIVGDILNRSPTSQSCHQHLLSTESVTNIENFGRFFVENNFLEWPVVWIKNRLFSYKNIFSQ